MNRRVHHIYRSLSRRNSTNHCWGFWCGQALDRRSRTGSISACSLLIMFLISIILNHHTLLSNESAWSGISGSSAAIPYVEELLGWKWCASDMYYDPQPSITIALPQWNGTRVRLFDSMRSRCCPTTIRTLMISSTRTPTLPFSPMWSPLLLHWVGNVDPT